jgi:hypothetical protein
MVSAIRCAIYTRKSTDEGLDSDFNTLDAQRESAEAFIVSQRHEGWLTLPEKYGDGGFCMEIRRGISATPANTYALTTSGLKTDASARRPRWRFNSRAGAFTC